MDALIGQGKVEGLLARAIASGRVAHAYLFLGPTSAGKATAARLFAQALNCEQGSGAGAQGAGDGALLRLAPCGRCESCRRIAAGTHPEVLEVRPESKSGQNISVDQARDIRRNAALRPKLGKRRVYIIPNAEAFNDESANALLKTLEEPSETVTLILCAPNPSQVLPTIRSRCQTVRFGLSSAAELAAALAARGTPEETAFSLARASGGRPGLALRWAEEPEVLQGRARILDLFEKALQARQDAGRTPSLGVLALRLAEQLSALVSKEKDDGDGPARPTKVQHSENLETALTYLRDLLLLTSGAERDLVQNQDRLPELERLAFRSMVHTLLQDIRTVREAQQLLDRNVQPQLVLERMFWALITGPLPLPARLFEEAYA